MPPSYTRIIYTVVDVYKPRSRGNISSGSLNLIEAFNCRQSKTVEVLYRSSILNLFSVDKNILKSTKNNIFVYYLRFISVTIISHCNNLLIYVTILIIIYIDLHLFHFSLFIIYINIAFDE